MNELKNRIHSVLQNRKRVIALVCAAALVLGLAAMPSLAKRSRREDGPQSSILSGKAETGSITTQIRGGGVLGAEEAVAIRLADGVKIMEFLVDNYSTVRQGDALASVDTVSVMTAISQVQETLDILKEDMESSNRASVTKTITAETSGTVKAVYGQKGDDASAVVLEHGALAVISMDGLMAVEFETKAKLSAGDSVWVSFEDGVDVQGRVESAYNGTATVTVTDRDYAIGAQVKITDSDDKKLGAGTLYVHNAWNVMAYSGKISNVNISAGDTVSVGKTIMQLTDVEQSSEYNLLAKQHRAYEELMLELFEMYQSGYITAPCDGMVSGVDHESIHLLSDRGGEYTVSLLANAPLGEGDAVYENYLGEITAVLGGEWTVMMDTQNWGDVDYTAPAVTIDKSLMTHGPVQMTQVTVFEYFEGQWNIVTEDVKQGDVLLFASDMTACVWAVRLERAWQEPVTPTPEVSPELSPQPSEQPDGEGDGGEMPTPPDGAALRCPISLPCPMAAALPWAALAGICRRKRLCLILRGRTSSM